MAILTFSGSKAPSKVPYKQYIRTENKPEEEKPATPPATAEPTKPETE